MVAMRFIASVSIVTNFITKCETVGRVNFYSINGEIDKAVHPILTRAD
jgi:hypothetical protein